MYTTVPSLASHTASNRLASGMQYAHDWTVREGDGLGHDRPPGHAAPGNIIAKNRQYYSRTGALWTDLYHCPEETRRRHALENPAAEGRFLAEVRRREEAEREAARQERRRTRARRSLDLGRMATRRVQNYDRHTPGTQRVQPPTDEHLAASEAYAAHTAPAPGAPPAVVPKDARYYSRTGFLWSDLSHCPADRLSLVVRPSTMAADRAGAAYLQGVLAQQHEAEREAVEARGRASNKRIRAIKTGQLAPPLSHGAEQSGLAAPPASAVARPTPWSWAERKGRKGATR